ncbi:MAG: hypothetical protein E6K81_04470 [Candidatus Eisenbacteria bacterium]|uniref:Metalloprotease TldD/E N-terminal domain-containing protein n=1 Tax=Eiseniibacteriota bacterium TaxID=2212470 RepID=A0A538UC63_UNCEI|nr:MAG: hypothetical protein E6K81_04470 [Candidatus Eisenbacteria bacterium]
MLPTENECRRITQRALNFTAADDASVGLSFGRGSHARSTTREPLASGVTQSVSVWARVTKDGRTGRVSLNETTDAALEKAMRRAEELAAVLPPDPESMGPIPPQKYLTIRAEDPATATAKAADRMSRVSKVLGPAAMENMDARGFFAAGGSVQCTANKAGNFGYHRATIGLGRGLLVPHQGHRRGRPRRDRAPQGAPVRQTAPPRPGRLHGHLRARGGRRPDRLQHRRRALGARRRGGSLLLLEAGRRLHGRREGVPRVGDHEERSARQAPARLSLGLRRGRCWRRIQWRR